MRPIIPFFKSTYQLGKLRSVVLIFGTVSSTLVFWLTPFQLSIVIFWLKFGSKTFETKCSKAIVNDTFLLYRRKFDVNEYNAYVTSISNIGKRPYRWSSSLLLQNTPISFHTNTEWPFYTFLMLPSCTMYWKTSLKKLLLELLQRNDFHLSSLDRGT